MDDELKPCPLSLCGGQAEAVWAPVMGAYVECGNCGLRTRIVAENNDNSFNMFAVVRLWNTRALSTAEAGVREALQAAHDQFAFYAREHRAAGKHEKAQTNEGFAKRLSDLLVLLNTDVEAGR